MGRVWKWYSASSFDVPDKVSQVFTTVSGYVEGMFKVLSAPPQIIPVEQNIDVYLKAIRHLPAFDSD